MAGFSVIPVEFVTGLVNVLDAFIDELAPV